MHDLDTFAEIRKCGSMVILGLYPSIAVCLFLSSLVLEHHLNWCGDNSSIVLCAQCCFGYLEYFGFLTVTGLCFLFLEIMTLEF